MWTLTKRALTFCVLLSGLVTTSTQAFAYAEAGPCTCVWDNTTKDYPANPKTAGFFSTTVRYSCGYLCFDGVGQIQHVIGQHQVSYSGQEAGNEVICDGMLYESHENPTGSYNRWVLFFWDGITHPVDARSSSSPTLREWAKNSCGGTSPKSSSNAAMTLKQVDELRASVGMKRIKTEEPPAVAKPFALTPELAKFCVASEVQAAFLKGEIHASLNASCAPGSNDEQAKAFEQIRGRSFHVKSSGEALAVVHDANQLLLCPAFAKTPNAAVLKALLEKALPMYDLARRNELSEFACTLGWRGLRFSLLPSAVQALLAP